MKKKRGEQGGNEAQKKKKKKKKSEMAHNFSIANERACQNGIQILCIIFVFHFMFHQS